MNSYLKVDEWDIIEERFDPHLNKVSESIFSLGNGRMGQRGNFEEAYTGDTLQGNYVAGVYYPDKTRVGWWKNGYPEYFAKVLNAANWIGIDVYIDGYLLDLNTCKVLAFRRILHMREGFLERIFRVITPDGKELEVHTRRFCSIVDDEAGAISYSVIPLNFGGELCLIPYIDGDVKNQDSNYDEKFWDEVGKTTNAETACLVMRTKKTGFDVCTGMSTAVYIDNEPLNGSCEYLLNNKYIGKKVTLEVKQGSTVTLEKFAVNISSENCERELLTDVAGKLLVDIKEKGFDVMLKQQALAWDAKWRESDIKIEGDAAAQQAIRFNIFHLNQTYTGEDDRLNIGPKGFTGEKYGGSTYWDTEAYCVPFYLATAPPEVTRNLLIYRYKHLEKAIENARKLGFGGGAALYPMVTINGEECHNEWEITFEEIHRNGAIAYAVYNYIRYTGDEAYLAEYGLEVLIAIARFWAQRVNFSIAKNKYVILGVTGPNEYENNVNNNWYTNTIAAWCLEYALKAIDFVKQSEPERCRLLLGKIHFDIEGETLLWTDIINNMYYPEQSDLGIFLQQDGFMDKEQILVEDLDPANRPLNQKWSWDRILRSVYIKQADVLQGMYFFEDRYSLDVLRRNFDFYEPRTVHESSLSPCVHSILAARLGDEDRAYQFYLRTARLDLDNYNSDTEDGLHITSMAGTWMSVVEGFAGMRVRNGVLWLSPFVPSLWKSFSFNIVFRSATLNICITQADISIINNSETDVTVQVKAGKPFTLCGNTSRTVAFHSSI